MRFLSIVVFIITSCAASLVAQDSLLILSKIKLHGLEAGKFRTLSRNPVQGLFHQEFPLLQVEFEGQIRNESTVLFQQRGSGKKVAVFKADAYQPISDSIKVWGNVLYNNGIIKNVVWNETSDIEFLYPYLSADSIGGDINSETYYFNGGYAQQLRNVILGAKLKYRALQEYRDIDPRPKNTVADFEISAGLGCSVSSKYTLSFAGSLRRYKQTNLIKYLSPLGGNRTYHLTGLGMDYVRFSGTNNNIYYKGNGVGATFDLISKDKNGINASLAYNRFWFEKILSDLNDLSMSDLLNQSYLANISYTTGTSKVLGVKLSTEYIKKNGTENLFGTSAGNVWTKIAEAKMYSEEHLNAQISGIWEQNIFHKSFFVFPSVGFNSLSLNYLTPTRSIRAQHLEAGITFGYSQQVGITLLTINTQAKYKYCTDKKSELNDVQTSHIMYNLVHATAELLQSSCANYRLMFRADFSTSRKIAYFIQIQANIYSYVVLNSTSNNISACLGIAL